MEESRQSKTLEDFGFGKPKEFLEDF